MTPKPSDVNWCKRTFSMMMLNGIWAVPRSGLVFTKTSFDPPILKLTNVMPWSNEMKAVINGEQELREYQRNDLECIREMFSHAGISVEGEVE